MHILKQIHDIKLISAIKPIEGSLLYDFVTEQKPKKIIETGSGKSTLYFLAAIRENKIGSLTSIDLCVQYDEKHNHNHKFGLMFNHAMHLFGKDFLDVHNDFIIEDSVEALELLDDKNLNCDVFMHDSLHTAEHLYSELITVEAFATIPEWFICHDVIHDFAKEVFGKIWFKERWKSYRRARHLEIFRRCK